MSAGVPPDLLAVKGGCHFGYFSHTSLQKYCERPQLTYSQTRQKKMVLKKMHESLDWLKIMFPS